MSTIHTDSSPPGRHLEHGPGRTRRSVSRSSTWSAPSAAASRRFEAGSRSTEDGSADPHGLGAGDGVRVQDENLEAHLQSPDFFDAERTPEISSARPRSGATATRSTVAGDLTIRGIDAAGRRPRGTITEPADDPYGGIRFGAHARDRGRPHAVRPQLEQPAPERRAGAGERRHADGRAVPGRRSNDDEGPRRSPAASGATRTTASCCSRPRGAAARGRRVRALGRPEGVPPYDEDDDAEPAPAAVAQLRAAIARRRRRAVRDARVQLARSPAS